MTEECAISESRKVQVANSRTFKSPLLEDGNKIAQNES